MLVSSVAVAIDGPRGHMDVVIAMVAVGVRQLPGSSRPLLTLVFPFLSCSFAAWLEGSSKSTIPALVARTVRPNPGWFSCHDVSTVHADAVEALGAVPYLRECLDSFLILHEPSSTARHSVIDPESQRQDRSCCIRPLDVHSHLVVFSSWTHIFFVSVLCCADLVCQTSHKG